MKKVVPFIVAAIVIIGGFLFYKSKTAAAGAAGVTTYKLAKVETGTVKKTVSATGALHPWSTVDIKSKAGGKVLQMLVDTGTVVKKGQKICLIDPSDTQLSLDQATADIKSADARIDQSQVTANLQVQQSKLGVTQAQAALETAIASRDAAAARLATAKNQMDAQPSLTDANVKSAKANYDNAEKQLVQMVEASNPQERANSKANLDQAKANLKNAESNLNRQKSLADKGFVSSQVVDQAQANRDVMAAQVYSAQRKLDTLDKELAANTQAMEARVAQAKAQYENAKAASVDIEIRKSSYNETAASLKQAEKQVTSARESLKLAQANMANVQIRQADIAASKATRMRAEASRVNAQTTLDQTTVTSPTDGVVLTKYVEQGTIISSALSFAATGNNIVQIGDVTRMYVDVTVDETDIANVELDQKVNVAIEAYSTIPFEGKVTRIDPQAVVEQNVTNIHVRVEIDNSDNKFQLLKPGMNATCEFVKNQKDNVITVPGEAIKTDEMGKPYVEVGVGGKPVVIDPKDKNPPDAGSLVDVKTSKRSIEVGLEGNDGTEVTSGLKEGEMVVTSKVEPVAAQAGGALGGNRMGGFGGRR